MRVQNKRFNIKGLNQAGYKDIEIRNYEFPF